LEIERVHKPSAVNSTEPDWESCTVQYLHRTVKDYIESPEVQQKLQLAMKSTFDPDLRYCAGILAMIKGRVLETVPLDEDRRFWRQVDQFMQHASRILPQNRVQLVELMDELDRACAAIARRTANL